MTFGVLYFTKLLGSEAKVCVLVPGKANDKNGRYRRMRVEDEEIHHAARCQQFTRAYGGCSELECTPFSGVFPEQEMDEDVLFFPK